MKKTLLALAALTLSANAAATGMYIGLNAGQSKFESEKDVGVGAYLGANLLPFLGVELGFQGHGQYEYDKYMPVYKEEVKTDSFYFALKPQIAVGPVQLFAKVGGHAWSQEYSYELFDTNINDYVDDRKVSGNGMMYGVGAEYFFSEGLSAGIQAQKFKTKHGDVDHIGINMTLHFM
ncbi:porin family protein [Vibrio sp. SCSIO 43136]|uniref:porin family protein n=1 Tax=Vibrio sp. SCSIO 43136 TaxID=2819101 RepID=UPI002074C698|nr:porin family protein [Vibrio sp. SCSIO 43136]USD66461.1 porin family protein [Vibrio sp. SCSIO 43136]